MKEYINGNYDTEHFCDQFSIIFDQEVDYNNLTKLEYKLFGELSTMTGRFSSFEEDLKIPNMYYTEEEIKKKVNEVVILFNCKL